jgi:transcriptional regulator with XRE-family HTH domain
MQDDLSPAEQLVERIKIAVGGGNDAEIAERLGVKPPSITHWKNGIGPGRKRLKQIAEEYKVSLDWLQYGDTADSNGAKDTGNEQNTGRQYDSLFTEALKLNPENKKKFDIIMELAEHQVSRMIQEQEHEPPRPKGKKS